MNAAKRRLIRLEQRRHSTQELYWAETEELAEQVRQQARRDGRPVPAIIVSGEPGDNPPWEMMQGRTLEELLEAYAALLEGSGGARRGRRDGC